MTENSEPVLASLSEYRGYLTEPFGPLGIICHTANTDFIRQVSSILYDKRSFRKDHQANPYVNNAGYLRNNYIVHTDLDRFATGEGKATLHQSIRGHDIFIITDVLSHHHIFPVFGQKHYASPDDHFRDLLRIVMAVVGKARRVNIIMPFLYEGRQTVRGGRESLDCASILQQLYKLGVSNFLAFDPHDERVENAVPLMGVEMPKSAYKIIESLIVSNPRLSLDSESTLVVTPDESGASRAVFYSSFLGVPLGIFYRKRDYTKIENDIHPVKDVLFLGDDYTGKNILIIDDMINSGATMLETATTMNKNGAKDIYCLSPFGLFTEGIEAFNQAHKEGIIKQVHCTNLIYRQPALLRAPWYVDVDMAPFVARLIEAINLDESLSQLVDPKDRIADLLGQMRIGEFLID